jgi:hypothetical protein
MDAAAHGCICLSVGTLSFNSAVEQKGWRVVLVCPSNGCTWFILLFGMVFFTDWGVAGVQWHLLV